MTTICIVFLGTSRPHWDMCIDIYVSDLLSQCEAPVVNGAALLCILTGATDAILSWLISMAAWAQRCVLMGGHSAAWIKLGNWSTAQLRVLLRNWGYGPHGGAGGHNGGQIGNSMDKSARNCFNIRTIFLGTALKTNSCCDANFFIVHMFTNCLFL